MCMYCQWNTIPDNPTVDNSDIVLYKIVTSTYETMHDFVLLISQNIVSPSLTLVAFLMDTITYTNCISKMV